MPGWWPRVIATRTMDHVYNHPPYNPSLWYNVISHHNLGVDFADYAYTGVFGLDGMCSFTPIAILNQQRFDRFAFKVVTNASGLVCDWRAAIYDLRDRYVSDAYFANSPNRKLIDLGTFQTNAPGVYEFAVPEFELASGNYWFALNIKFFRDVQLQAFVPYNSGGVGADLTSGRPPFIYGSTTPCEPFGSGPSGRISFLNLFDWTTFPTLPDPYPDQFGGATLAWEELIRPIQFRTIAP